MERGPDTDSGAHAHATAVRLRDPLHDEQAEARALLAAGGAAARDAEGKEQLAEFFGRNSLPAIADGDADRAAARVRLHRDGGARR